MPTKKKAYCFTCNNYTQDEYEHLLGVCKTLSNYAILGREIGGSGTPHIQGYIVFTRAYQFKTVKDRHLPRCHVQVAAGDADANRRYCSKDGNFEEFGTLPTQELSQQSREYIAERFQSELHHGRPGMARFASEYPGTWYFSGHSLLRNYMTLQEPSSRSNIYCLWLYGPPGVGKSRRAHDSYPDAYVKDPRTKWWNGYMLENEVIIDDFGPSGIDINHLLRWFDRYKCYVESKGGMLPLRASKFCVTSNFHPEKCFSFAGELNPQLPALYRRIVIEEMK